MAMSNELRSEIETIMTEHQRTRFAKVLVGMANGLSDEEMSAQAHAAREPIRADGVAAVRRIVDLCLDGRLVTARSDAENQSNFYREMLNYRRSPELDQYIMTCLAKLHAIDPNVKFTRLGDVWLGGGGGTDGSDKPEAPLCPECGLHHAGKC